VSTHSCAWRCSCTISDRGATSCRSDKLVDAAVGVKKYKGVKYSTTVQWLTGLLPPGSNGVNHGMVTTNACDVIVDPLAIGIATDGKTALLTITIL
jgi:hypothetical protein